MELVRWDENSFAGDAEIKVFWPVFVLKACEIYNLCSVKHNISITDLILSTSLTLSTKISHYFANILHRYNLLHLLTLSLSNGFRAQLPLWIFQV